MARRLERRYWEENVSVKAETKKVHQIYSSNDFMVNEWLKKNQDVEIVDIKITGTRNEDLVMVIYKIELEEAE